MSPRTPPYVVPDLRKVFQDYDVDEHFSEGKFHHHGITKLY
jgi:hypothetical protein